MFQLSKHDALNKKCHEVCSCSQCHASGCINSRIMGGEKQIEYDLETKHTGNTVAPPPHMIVAFPFFGGEDKPIGSVIAYRDITKLKQAEMALRKSYDEMEQKVEERTRDLKQVNERLEKEVKERKRIGEDLKVALKRITCMHDVGKSIRGRGSIESFFIEAINLIPSGLQFPDIASARIIFEDREYKTQFFKESEWKISSAILVGGQRAGAVEVVYNQTPINSAEEPFLEEERELIYIIASALRVVRRKMDFLTPHERKY